MHSLENQLKGLFTHLPLCFCFLKKKKLVQEEINGQVIQ